jgi:hypothetical protein
MSAERTKMRCEIDLTSDWKFAESFAPLRQARNNEAITKASSYLADAQIKEHRFFQFAATHRSAMLLWTSQEVVTSNAFSQVLFALYATLKNVNLRSFLLPVVVGEHSKLKDGIAFNSHPYLLSKLCIDIGLEPEKIKPLDCTRAFIQALAQACTNNLYGLGLIGIGNEKMLIEEYSAVEVAFSTHFPAHIYKPFLRANIEEDSQHSALIEQAAAALISGGQPVNDFLRGARDGIAARLTYYDRLLTRAETQLMPFQM